MNKQLCWTQGHMLETEYTSAFHNPVDKTLVIYEKQVCMRCGKEFDGLQPYGVDYLLPDNAPVINITDRQRIDA